MVLLLGLDPGETNPNESPGYKHAQYHAKNENDAEGIVEGGEAEPVHHPYNHAIDRLELKRPRVYHS